jgi:hypothetical protein
LKSLANVAGGAEKEEHREEKLKVES